MDTPTNISQATGDYQIYKKFLNKLSIGSQENCYNCDEKDGGHRQEFSWELASCYKIIVSGTLSVTKPTCTTRQPVTSCTSRLEAVVVGRVLSISKSQPRKGHPPFLFMMLCHFQNCFCFRSSPFISNVVILVEKCHFYNVKFTKKLQQL